MHFVFLPIYTAETKIICGYNFVAPLNKMHFLINAQFDLRNAGAR